MRIGVTGKVLVLLTVACGQQPNNEPPPIRLFEAQRQALEQAKAVEQQQQERMEQMRRQLQEQEK